jgi:acyl-ACP thioesterase
MATKSAYSFRVEPQEVDFTLRITLGALGENVLNVAGVDAHSKGFGVDALNRDNYSWVLSRIAFEFDSRPSEYTDYRILTWISDYGRALSTRNFELIDRAGVRFGRVVSQWCMIDLTERRAVDLRAVAEQHNAAIVDEASPAERPCKVPAAEGEPQLTHRVAYSDIDFNRHVNTMRYIDLMLDVLPIERFAEDRPLRLDLNFIKESRYGDTLAVVLQESPERSLIEIRTTEGTPICRGVFTWR